MIAIPIALVLVLNVGSQEGVTENQSIRVLVEPTIGHFGQDLLVTVAGFPSGSLIRDRSRLQSKTFPPEDRDFWLDIKVLGGPHGSNLPPIPEYGCQVNGKSVTKYDFVRVGPNGFRKTLSFEQCYGPLVKGSRYQVVVHWKTTVPRNIRAPKGLIVDEYVSDPVIIDFKGLPNRLTLEGRLHEVGFEVQATEMFVREVRELALSGNWVGLCKKVALPLDVSNFRGTRTNGAVDDSSGCETVMPWVFDRRYLETIRHDPSRFSTKFAHVGDRGGLKVGPFVTLDLTCPSPLEADCKEKAIRIVRVEEGRSARTKRAPRLKTGTIK